MNTAQSFTKTLAIFLVLCVVTVMAHSSDSKSNEGGIGNFKAVLLMTTDSETALENWVRPSPGVAIPSTDIASSGQAIEALVIFTGCKANEEGNCVAEIDYRIDAPDGSLYAEYLGTELWRDKPSIPEGKLQLSVDRVGLIVEPDEQVGTYTISCTVRDLVAEAEFSISSKFEVIETSEVGEQ